MSALGAVVVEWRGDGVITFWTSQEQSRAVIRAKTLAAFLWHSPQTTWAEAVARTLTFRAGFHT